VNNKKIKKTLKKVLTKRLNHVTMVKLSLERAILKARLSSAKSRVPKKIGEIFWESK